MSYLPREETNPSFHSKGLCFLMVLMETSCTAHHLKLNSLEPARQLTPLGQICSFLNEAGFSLMLIYNGICLCGEEILQSSCE